MSGLRGQPGQRGFALLIVLWALPVLAVLGTQIEFAGRQETRVASQIREAAVVDAAADAGIDEAIFHLLIEKDRKSRAQEQYVMTRGRVELTLRLETHAGRVNPNTASVELLAGLLTALGQPPSASSRLADAIVDWRTRGRLGRRGGAKLAEYRAAGRTYGPPSEAFHSLDELGDVLGMTPALLAALQPHLSLWWDGDPDASLASPEVLQALHGITDATQLLGSAGSGMQVVGIDCTAVSAAATARHRVVVEISAASTTRPWRVVEADR